MLAMSLCVCIWSIKKKKNITLEPEEQWRCHHHVRAYLQYPNLFIAVYLMLIAATVLFTEEEGISRKNSEGR